MVHTLPHYHDMLDGLEEAAPAQAQLLKYFLLQREMGDSDTICRDLDISLGNFRQLIDKLRDRGIEVVCKRTSAPDDKAKDVKYVYGVRTTEVEDWSVNQRKTILTAWNRTTKVFERHLFQLDMDPRDIYKILGVMEYVTDTLKTIDLNVSLKSEAAQDAERERIESATAEEVEIA